MIVNLNRREEVFNFTLDDEEYTFTIRHFPHVEYIVSNKHWLYGPLSVSATKYELEWKPGESIVCGKVEVKYSNDQASPGIFPHYVPTGERIYLT